MADTKGSFVASGLPPPTKYQTIAASKVSMKASHCKGHEPLFYCKVLGRSNTEIVTVSSCNNEIFKNRQDTLLFGKTVFTNLLREHSQLCIYNLSYKKKCLQYHLIIGLESQEHQVPNYGALEGISPLPLNFFFLFILFHHCR